MNTNYNYFQNTYKTSNFVYRKLSQNAPSPQPIAESKAPQEQQRDIAPKTPKKRLSNLEDSEMKGKIEALQRQLAEAHAKLSRYQESATNPQERREALAPIQQKELDYFLKEKRNPKERYLLFNMLKYGLGKSNMQIEQGWTVYKLRSQFTKQLSEHTGFYYDGNKLVVTYGPESFSSFKDYSFLVFHSNPSKLRQSRSIATSPYHSKDTTPGGPAHLKREMTRYLGRFKDYQRDTINPNEIRKHMATRGLQHYVMYRFLESYGCEVDHNWSKQEILDNLAGSGALKRWYTGNAKTARIYRADRDVILKKVLKEYVRYSGIGTQVTDAFVASMRDKILKLSKGFED